LKNEPEKEENEIRGVIKQILKEICEEKILEAISDGAMRAVKEKLSHREEKVCFGETQIPC